MNKIFIQFFGDKIKSPDGRLLMSKDVDGNEQLKLIRKIIQEIYEKERAPVAKTVNAETLVNNPLKIEFDKLKWSDVFRPHEKIDFSKITTDELEIILREVLEISKCPLGKVYDAKKKACVPVVQEGQLIINNTGIFTIDNVFNASLIKHDKAPSDDKLVNKDENNLNEKNRGNVVNDKAMKKKKPKNSHLKVVEDIPKGNTLSTQSIKVDFNQGEGAQNLHGVIDIEKLLKYAQLKKESETLPENKAENEAAQPKNEISISTGSEGPSINKITEKIQEIIKPEEVVKSLSKETSKEGQEITTKIQEIIKPALNGNQKLELFQNVELNTKSSVPDMSINTESNKSASKIEEKSDKGLSMQINGENQLNLKPELIKGEKSGSGSMSISQNLKGGSTIENGGLQITSQIHPEVEVPGSSGSMKMTPITLSGSQDNMQELIANIMKLVKNGKTNDLAELLKGSKELNGKVSVKSENDAKISMTQSTAASLIENVSQTTQKAVTIHITDEGEIPIATRENGKAKIEFGPNKFLSDLNTTKSEMKIEKMPSKIILRATLPNGEVVHVGERNFSNEALLNANGTLTLDKLGLDLQNMTMSNFMRESLNNMKLEVKSEKPTEVKIQTKKIQPAKFVQKINFEKRTGPETTTVPTKDETTEKPTSAQPTTAAVTSLTTEASTKPSGGPEIFSNLFKPMKEAIKKNKDKITRVLGLNDQDQRRFMDIPASNKEDIDKILKVKPATMEFKSVLGKTLEDVSVGKLFDDTEANHTTVAGEVPLNSHVMQSSNNLLLHPLKIIKGT